MYLFHMTTVIIARTKIKSSYYKLTSTKWTIFAVHLLIHVFLSIQIMFANNQICVGIEMTCHSITNIVIHLRHMFVLNSCQMFETNYLEKSLESSHQGLYSLSRRLRLRQNLPPNLVMSRSYEIGCCNDHITPKFDRHLPMKFRIIWKV